MKKIIFVFSMFVISLQGAYAQELQNSCIKAITSKEGLTKFARDDSRVNWGPVYGGVSDENTILIPAKSKYKSKKLVSSYNLYHEANIYQCDVSIPKFNRTA